MSSGDGGDYLERMRSSRKGPAVLKILLTNLRASKPRALVFAFEGDDDKSAYYSWIRRIQDNLSYEPFPCGGKKQVKDFCHMLERDLGNLRDGVYLFVDRDFDDLEGWPEAKNVFMTDRYSVENYFVSKDVVDEILKNELHCHAHPVTRDEVIMLFERAYGDFLTATKPLNLRLFLARRLGVNASLPTKLSKFASVTVSSATAAADKEMSIKLDVEIDAKDHPDLVAEFEALDPITRYRGKFALLFLKKWLELVATDRCSSDTVLFKGVERRAKVNTDLVSLAALAMKSIMPPSLSTFIARIPVVGSDTSAG